MTTNELVDYWSGYLLIEIGRGKFREGVCLMLTATTQEASTAAEKKARKK
jgi:hypothetical protein